MTPPNASTVTLALHGSKNRLAHSGNRQTRPRTARSLARTTSAQGADSQISRVANRFGIVIDAGELAADLKITQYSANHGPPLPRISPTDAPTKSRATVKAQAASSPPSEASSNTESPPFRPSRGPPHICPAKSSMMTASTPISSSIASLANANGATAKFRKSRAPSSKSAAGSKQIMPAEINNSSQCHSPIGSGSKSSTPPVRPILRLSTSQNSHLAAHCRERGDLIDFHKTQGGGENV